MEYDFDTEDDELGYFDTDKEVDDTLYISEEPIEIKHVAKQFYPSAKYQQLPEDVIYEIYLNLDIDSLLNYCQVN